MKTKQNIVRQLLLCTGLFLLAGAGALRAGNDTWNGLGADNNWGTTLNWTVGSASRPPVSGDTLFFDGSTRLAAANNLSAYNIQGITFNPTAGAFTLSGNLITNNAATTDNSLNLETVSLNMAFPSTHTLNVIAGGTMAIKGVISGAGGITKTGGGAVAFNGINPQTYTGASAINAGTLTLDFVTGAPGPNIINKASALQLGGGTMSLLGAGSIALSSNLFAGTTINAGSSTVLVTNTAGAALGALTFALGGTVKFVGPATTNGTGNVAATGTITTTTAGGGGAAIPLGLLFGGNPVNGTTPAVAAYATVGLFDWASTDTSAGAAGSSPYTIIGGSQVAGFYTNVVPVSAVSVGNVDMTNNLTTADGGAERRMTTLRFNTPSATTFTLGTNAILSGGGILITPSMTTNNALLTTNSGGGGNWQIFRQTNPNGAQEGVIWQNNIAGYFTLNAAIPDGRDGTSDLNYIVKTGDGTAVFGGVSTYTGQTYVNGGNLVITADSALGAVATAAALNLNGGTLFGNATFTLDNAGANRRPITLLANGGGLAAAAGNTMTIDGIISGSGALTLGIPASTANSNTVGLLPGSGAGTANPTPVNATGTVSLSATNTYTGNTVVASGTLALAATGLINSTPQISTAVGAVYDVSAVTVYTLGGSQSLAGSGTNNGIVNTTSGSIVYAGTDGGYGTNAFNNNLTNVAGALCYLDLGTVYNGSNDLISVGGVLTLNSTTFHLKAPGTSANLDTNADYVLLAAASISGAPNSTPVWDIQPANAANFIVLISGNSVVLHYSAAAPPSGSGIASPSTVNRNQNTRITVTATPGTDPTIASVILNATLIGGSSSVTLVQSNTSSLYTNTVTVSAGNALGIFALPATITDASTLSAVANVSVTVVNTQTWNGAGANDNWSNSTNWVSTVAPVTGDFLTFAGATRLTPSMDANNNLTGLAFASGAASFTLGTPASSLTLSANGVTNNSANLQTVNLPVTLTAAQTFNAGAGGLAIGQPVTNGGFTVSLDGAANTAISGGITGAGGLTKNGAGTATLQAANTYAGNTSVAAGILEVTNNGAISGAAANVSAVSGAKILVDGGIVTATTGNVGTPSAGLAVSSGTANYSGALSMDLGNNSDSIINVSGGTLTANSLALGRTTLNNGAQPGSGSTSVGLYVHGGAVTITNNLGMGTTTAANSSVNTRVDSGSLTVGGVLTIGLNNGGRWSDLDVNGGTVTVNDTTTGISIGGPFSGNAVLLMRSGTATAGKISFGQATVSSTNMTAAFSLTGGSLYVGSGGMAQISTGAGFVSTVSLTGGTLGAAGDWSSSMNMTLSAATIKAADAANTAHNIYLTGILSGSGATLTKTGSGILTLSGVNTYSGVTTISAGVLALTNDATTGSIANSTTINVAGGAMFDVNGLVSVGGFMLGSGKTIAGTGTVAGNFTAADNSTISPAGTGAQGTLYFTNGLAVTNATLKLELGSDPSGVSPANDAINVTGDLAVGGSNNVVVLPVGSLGLGTYKLIKYTGSFFGDISNLTCVSGVLTNPPNEIDLIVTSVRPTATLIWRGDGSGNAWDTGVSSNWLNGVSYDRFYTSDTNLFNDSATNFVVDLSGTLTPASASVVTVNATNDYTFTAGGDISGTTGLTKTNSGKLTIQGSHDYTGVTTINGGTLSVSNLANGGTASSIGAAGVSSANLVLNGGALEYLGGNKTIDRGATLQSGNGTLSVAASTLTINGTLTGSGSLTKTGNGQITLGGGNNYQGGTIINAGTIRGNPASALGTNTLTLSGSAANSATFQFSGDSQTLSDVLNVVGTNNFTVNGGNDTASKVTGSGTVYHNGSGAQTLTLQTIDSTSFTGTFFMNTLPFLRFAPSSGTTLNASNATFNLGTASGQLFNRDGGSYSLGALAGGSGTFLKGSGNSGSAVTTYTIGGNNADADFSGVIATGTGGTGAKVNIVKVGTGRMTLSGASTYNGTTTINTGVLALGDGVTDGSFNNTTPITLNSNAVIDVTGRGDGTLTVGGSATQLLVGDGVIKGQLNVGSSGTVTPGDVTSLIGRLTATNAITLGGVAALKLNRTNSPNCDRLVSSNSVTYGGTLTAVNLGGTLLLGDTFTLFSAPGGLSGTFTATNLPVLGGGLGWSWNPTTGQLIVVVGVNTNPTNLTTVVNGSSLELSWPADHTGWHLQSQTNSLADGLGTNWVTIPGTDLVNSYTNTIDAANGTVFYRMIYP